ncbi:hypothetical protein CAMRE0001_2834 [Campylobacter rectus RM3267]|uniref:Uncharacterized protein n=1 Tax=Campylobacter rectus RM3267 TaxID=553218 RepID=B9D124_CAMRE|nr:hypothetical protein CAMRE0001_2834 [Campylobacter rectus RM3267]
MRRQIRRSLPAKTQTKTASGDKFTQTVPSREPRMRVKFAAE